MKNRELLTHLRLDLMTESNTNILAFQLKQQYRERIDYLQKQIIRQQTEIIELQNIIKQLTEGKEYDC